MAEYESWIGENLPPWLLGEWGERYRVAVGGILDAAALGTTGGIGEASKAHFVGLAPQDALPLYQTDRWVPSIAGETLEALRLRLQEAWDAFSGLGPTAGLKAFVDAAMGTPCTIYDVANDGWLTGYQPSNLEDANADNWSRFWVVFAEPHPWAPVYFGPSLTFGPDTTFGLDITQSELALLRHTIQQYRPAHMLPVEAWIVTDATTPAALKANHTVTANVYRFPLLVRTWYSASLPQFNGGRTFGERFVERST